jgi:hypothetical protein
VPHAAADAPDMSYRSPGQHARGEARRRQRHALVLIAAVVVPALVIGALVIGALVGFTRFAFVAAETVVIAVMLLVDRRLVPAIIRWRQGARGEEAVGEVLDRLRADGWMALHDVSTGRGNIDHVLVGPAGVLTVETKSHAGVIAIDRIDERMLRQAYAQSKAVERVVGRKVTPLLVFSRAYTSRPVSRRRGVTILPARMLAGHLARRAATL